MTGYEPLYVGGKRDKARRFINPSTGEIISRRQHIKLTEGASPESKAYARYLRGLAPKGITAKKYERRLKRKAEKEPRLKKRPEEPITDPTRIQEKWGWKEVPPEPRGYYQLQGRYLVRDAKTGEFTTVTGYSTATITKRRGSELQILRSQAIDHGKAQLDGYEWVLEGIEYEVWLKW
jgi:hypothetical protein